MKLLGINPVLITLLFCKTLNSMLKSYEILLCPLNLSDHLPVAFDLKMLDSDIQGTTGNDKRNHTIRDFRWDKGNIHGYYYDTRSILNKVNHCLFTVYCLCFCTRCEYSLLHIVN